MMTCREAARLVSERTDRSLPLVKRISLLLHLLVCRFCRRYSKQVKFICEMSKRLGNEEKLMETHLGEERLPDRTRELLKRKLGTGEKPTPDTPTDIPPENKKS